MFGTLKKIIKGTKEKAKRIKQKTYDRLKLEKSPVMKRVRKAAKKYAIPAFPDKKEVERYKIATIQHKEAQKQHKEDLKKWEKEEKAIRKGGQPKERLHPTEGVVIEDISHHLNKPQPPEAPKPPKTPLFSETLGESTKRLGRNIGEKVVAKVEKRRPRLKKAPSYKSRLTGMTSVKGKKGQKHWYEEDFDF